MSYDKYMYCCVLFPYYCLFVDKMQNTGLILDKCVKSSVKRPIRKHAVQMINILKPCVKKAKNYITVPRNGSNTHPPAPSRKIKGLKFFQHYNIIACHEKSQE